jgi:hypothetical protein
MYVRAGLGIVALLAMLATKNLLRDQIQHKHPTLTPAQLDTEVNAALLVGLITGAVFVAIYALLATQVRRGQSWARVVTLVLAGLGAALSLVSLAQPTPAVGRVITFFGIVLDIAIIFFLTRRATSEFFHPVQA